MVTRIADIDLKLCKLKNEWKGDQGPPPPPKKVTKVTRIADIDIKLSKLKNKEKGVFKIYFTFLDYMIQIFYFLLI